MPMRVIIILSANYSNNTPAKRGVVKIRLTQIMESSPRTAVFIVAYDVREE